MQKWKLSSLALAASCALFTVDAMAIGPGFYMGLMMGPATNGGSEQRVQIEPTQTAPSPQVPGNAGNPPYTPNTQLANPSSTQFGSRAYLGYKFNPYAGFELGFSFFSGINYNVMQTANTVQPGNPEQNPNPPTEPYQAAAGTTARIRGIDLLGKLDYSYNDTIGLFAKVGVVGVYQTIPGGLQPTTAHWEAAPVTASNPTGTKLVTTGSNQYKTKWAPAFSLGVTYDFNQSWQMDVSMNRYLVGGPISSTTLFALGLSYHFVDVYCGQFLC